MKNFISSYALKGTCQSLSDGADFAHGMKKVGFHSLKFAATVCALLALKKLIQYIIGSDRKQKLLPSFNWDTKEFTATPATKAEELITPLKDKNGKAKGKTITITATTITQGITGRVACTAFLSLCAVITYAFWNTLEKGLQSASNHLECNLG
jgi:hypothetical protein